MQSGIAINITRIVPRWDRAAGTLWLDLVLDDGRRYSVGFPVLHYANLFVAALQAEGVTVQPEVGEDLASVDGLFGFIKRTARRASRSVKKATRRVSRKLVNTASKAVRTATRGIKRGTRVIRRGVQKYGATALNAAASGASFVPGLGSGLAAGLAGASALAQGKSLAEIGRQAALGALPGGPMARAALEAGIGVASGKRVDRALLQGVRKSIPGGHAGQAIFNASLAVARGKRPDRAIKNAAVQAAMSQVPRQYRRAAAAGIAAAQGKRVDRALMGAARQIAAQQMRGKSQDRVFQAVSGRGLAALAGSNKTATLANEAQSAAARIRAGRGSNADRATVRRAASVVRRVQSAGRSRSPFARMAVAAIKSQPGARGAPRRVTRAMAVPQAQRRYR